jgi:hypothetical protein
MVIKSGKLYNITFKHFPFLRYSFPRTFGIFKDIKNIELSVKFPTSCNYRHGNNDDLDINKLLGVSFGIFGVHENSIRIGWNIQDNKPSLWLYYYNYGLRYHVKLGSFDFEKEYNLNINFKDDGMTVEGANGHSYIFIKRFFEFEEVSKYAFLLQPYFGGNRKPPHKMDIELGIKITTNEMVKKNYIARKYDSP